MEKLVRKRKFMGKIDYIITKEITFVKKFNTWMN